jgi:hypothetical protein
MPADQVAAWHELIVHVARYGGKKVHSTATEHARGWTRLRLAFEWEAVGCSSLALAAVPYSSSTAGGLCTRVTASFRSARCVRSMLRSTAKLAGWQRDLEHRLLRRLWSRILRPRPTQGIDERVIVQHCVFARWHRPDALICQAPLAVEQEHGPPRNVTASRLRLLLACSSCRCCCRQYDVMGRHSRRQQRHNHMTHQQVSRLLQGYVLRDRVCLAAGESYSSRSRLGSSTLAIARARPRASLARPRRSSARAPRACLYLRWRGGACHSYVSCDDARASECSERRQAPEILTFSQK